MKRRSRISPHARFLLGLLAFIPFFTAGHLAFEVELELWRLPVALWIRAFLVGVPIAWILRNIALRAPSAVQPIWILFSASWVSFVFWKAILGKKILFAVFGLILSLCLYLWLNRFRRETGRTYMSSGLRWFEAEPNAIPHLAAESSGVRFRVSRLDEEGLFLFGTQEAIDSLASSRDGRVELSIRQETTGYSVNVLGEIVQEVHPREGGLSRAGSWLSGLGLRFVDPSVDRRKSLGDFVERLRGEGHVL
jgi:hypothetical protein